MIRIGDGLIGMMALLLLPLAAHAATEVVANGLFKDKAMLTINGETRLLKAGETSPEGVKLISSSSKQAVLVIDGQRTTMRVSQRISSSFKSAEAPPTVTLPRSRNGHFYARGAINGQPAEFMIDTGATSVAMNLNHAREFGIDLGKSTVSVASTAGGIVKTYIVDLQRVSIGAITIHNVAATVVDGDFPVNILLGNSFLSKVDMSEQSGALVLKRKF